MAGGTLTQHGNSITSVDKAGCTDFQHIQPGDWLTIEMTGPHDEWWIGKFIGATPLVLRIEPTRSGIFGEPHLWTDGGEHEIPWRLVRALWVSDGEANVPRSTGYRTPLRAGPILQELPIGTRVKPKRGRRSGTVVRILERDHASGIASQVAVRWDASPKWPQQWATDVLVAPAENEVAS